jgi:hypothetical protein
MMKLEPITENAYAFFWDGASATTYGRAEDVRVIPIVISELEFSDIKRQIFATGFVEATHDAPLQQRPKTVNRRSVDRAINVLPCRMIDGLMIENLVQRVIGRVFVGRDQADLFGHGLANEGVQRCGVGVGDDARNDVAFPLDGTDNDFLASTARSWSALVGMAVLVLATDIGFVDLDDAHEFAELGVDETGANAVAHIPSRAVRAEAHHTVDLERGNTLLAGQHEVNDLEPLPHANIGVLKDGPNQHREPIAAFFGTFSALPVKRAIGDGINIGIAASRAGNGFRPASRDQISFAGIIGRKQVFELRDRHLRSEFDLAHGGIPDV